MTSIYDFLTEHQSAYDAIKFERHNKISDIQPEQASRWNKDLLSLELRTPFSECNTSHSLSYNICHYNAANKSMVRIINNLLKTIERAKLCWFDVDFNSRDLQHIPTGYRMAYFGPNTAK